MTDSAACQERPSVFTNAYIMMDQEKEAGWLYAI